MSQIETKEAVETRAARAPRSLGERRFGRVNWLGMRTLAYREILRFVSVWQQTLLAPLITAGLFLTVFALAFGQNRPPVMGVPYLAFLAPGILMMTVIQNAFANTSSSIIIAKVQGNIVDTLMPPLSPFETLAGYLVGGQCAGFGRGCGDRARHRAGDRALARASADLGALCVDGGFAAGRFGDCGGDLCQ